MTPSITFTQSTKAKHLTLGGDHKQARQSKSNGTLKSKQNVQNKSLKNINIVHVQRQNLKFYYSYYYLKPFVLIMIAYIAGGGGHHPARTIQPSCRDSQAHTINL